MPCERAASISFLMVGMVATQRGRAPQLFFMKSSTSRAVVLGSTVTGLSSGADGGFTLAQSVTMSPVKAGLVASAARLAKAAMQHTCRGVMVVFLPLALMMQNLSCPIPYTKMP